jgi:MoxR-vWA-beta-propeller ternary system domain bpX4
MSVLIDFLQNLFGKGEVIFYSPPERAAGEQSDVISVLKRAFDSYSLEIAGPPIEFDAAAALSCSEFVHWACWFLLHRDSPADEVERRLQIPHQPTTAGQHLSADLTLRYLAPIHRRAMALSPADVLTARITGVLQAFPLSGVLAPLDVAPTSPLDFTGHEGLELLYAERFARRPRDHWHPDGRMAELVELVQR